MTMLDSIDAQVPNAQALINEYAEIVKTYLQEQLDKASQDEKVIAAFEEFLKQIPEFLARPVENKITLEYDRVIHDKWKYCFNGYTENTFLNVPENVMNAFHNGLLLVGIKFALNVKNLKFTIKNSLDETLVATEFRLDATTHTSYYKGCMRIIEMSGPVDDY